MMGYIRSAVRDKRRLLVERRVLRGLSCREIEAEFVDLAASAPESGAANPLTGAAWDYTTISRDIKVLEERWRQAAVAARSLHKAHQLAEIREHRRCAWLAGDLAEVRLSIKLEMELLGTQAAELSLGLDLSTLTEDQLERIIAGEDPLVVLAASGTG